ncbi:uncharacterized protein LOC109489356 [Ailuropoda melanoleuca]|uniref:uncharacterized protein LOC109489356 n=1 Tax=Ailuropoda melanoleuca TaxID=9646 RepID=UPI001494CAE4|nr:uncharacterized protein LOC109489356 [Ailuropoda melanoleuca]
MAPVRVNHCARQAGAESQFPLSQTFHMRKSGNCVGSGRDGGCELQKNAGCSWAHLGSSLLEADGTPGRRSQPRKVGARERRRAGRIEAPQRPAARPPRCLRPRAASPRRLEEGSYCHLPQVCILSIWVRPEWRRERLGLRTSARRALSTSALEHFSVCNFFLCTSLQFFCATRSKIQANDNNIAHPIHPSDYSTVVMTAEWCLKSQMSLLSLSIRIKVGMAKERGAKDEARWELHWRRRLEVGIWTRKSGVSTSGLSKENPSGHQDQGRGARWTVWTEEHHFSAESPGKQPQTGVCTLVCTAARFTTAERWKQPEGPSVVHEIRESGNHSPGGCEGKPRKSQRKWV